MKWKLVGAFVLLGATAAYAADTIPYISGTGGLTNGHVVASGAGVGQLVDGGTAAATNTPNTWTATQTFQGIAETATALTGCNGSTATMDMSAGTVFHCTVSAGTVTFAVSNAAASGKVSSFTLELTNPGSQTLAFMSGTKWPGGSQPTWTAAGVDVLSCFTYDGATTWRCVRSMTDSK